MILILTIFYLGLFAAGNFIIRLTGQNTLHGWKKAAAAFCVGQGCYTLLLWMGGWLGLFQILTWMMPIVALSIWLCLAVLKLRIKIEWPVDKKHFFSQLATWLFIALLAIFLLRYHAEMTLTAPIESVAGMGNWGLKSKILFLNQGVPDNYISEYSTNYGKFSYPIGFPVMNAALYTMSGQVDEVLVKANAILLLVATYVVISFGFMERWKHFSLAPAFGLFGFFLGTAALQVTDGFYSEPLLLFCAATALMCLFERNQYPLAIACAACCAWVKHEGILFFGLLVIFLCIKHWRDPWKLLSWSIVAGGLFVVLWQIYVRIEHVNDSDFNFGGSCDIGKISEALRRIWDVGIINFQNYSGAFLCLPLMLAFALYVRDINMFYCGLIPVVMLTIFVGAMAYSKVDLDWQLDAANRYLMLPAVCVFMGLSAICRQTDNTCIIK